MNFVFGLILVAQIVSALSIIGLVLLQHGKGPDMGAAFGSGASGSLFGATGSANFLSRTTGILAAVFFASTLALSYLSSVKPKSTGVLEQGLKQTAPVTAPATIDGQAVPAVPATPDKSSEIPK